MNKRSKIVIGVTTLALLGLFLLNLGTNKQVSKDNELDSPAVPVQSSVEATKVQKLKLVDLKVDFTRTVILSGPIIDESIQPVIQYLLKLEETNEPIYVLIDSPGGSILAGEKFISVMESATGPVYTVCTNICASMASTIHSHGTKRYGTNRSLFLYHDASGGFDGSFARMRSQFNVIQRKVDKLDEYICYRAHIDCTEFKKNKTDEIWLDAEDALNKGFVDAVVKTPVNPLIQPSPITVENLTKAPVKTWSFESIR